jgi:hypothetical protein
MGSVPGQVICPLRLKMWQRNGFVRVLRVSLPVIIPTTIAHSLIILSSANTLKKTSEHY